MNLTSKNLLIFGVLGIGAFWLLSQRRVVAATSQTNPITGQRYAASPNAYTPTSNNANAAGWGQAAGALSSLVSGLFGARSSGSAGRPASAESDGSIGEAAARQWYLDNQDSFAVNPPVITTDMYNAAMREGLSEY